MLVPPHSLQWLHSRWCWQMLVPPHSLHLLHSRWCWQTLPPPHSLHLSLRRWCGHRLVPPHSLHWLLRRWCWQMLAPPHSLHVLLMRWCGDRPAPPHFLHWLLWRRCGQMPLLRVAPCTVTPAVAPGIGPHPSAGVPLRTGCEINGAISTGLGRLGPLVPNKGWKRIKSGKRINPFPVLAQELYHGRDDCASHALCAPAPLFAPLSRAAVEERRVLERSEECCCARNARGERASNAAHSPSGLQCLCLRRGGAHQ